jgi:hypothetical protein
MSAVHSPSARAIPLVVDEQDKQRPSSGSSTLLRIGGCDSYGIVVWNKSCLYVLSRRSSLLPCAGPPRAATITCLGVPLILARRGAT